MRQKISLPGFWALILILGAGMLGGCSPTLAPITLTASPSPIASTATAVPSDTPAPTVAPLATPTAPLVTSEPPAPLSSPTAGPSNRPTLRPIPTVIAGASPVNPSMENLVAQARTDLAARLGVAANSIVVKSAEDVEWPDGSLGCPKPGFMYPQVVTAGVLIVLEVNGQAYEYHGTRTRVSLCEKK